MPKKKLPRLGINTGGSNVLDFTINEDGWCDVTMTEHRAVTRGIMTKSDLTALRDWLTEITHEPTFQERLDAAPEGTLLKEKGSNRVRFYVKVRDGGWLSTYDQQTFPSNLINEQYHEILYPTEEV